MVLDMMMVEEKLKSSMSSTLRRRVNRTVKRCYAGMPTSDDDDGGSGSGCQTRRSFGSLFPTVWMVATTTSE